MQEQEFLTQITQRLDAHSVSQKALLDRWVQDFRQLSQLRVALLALSSGLAFGTGLGLALALRRR